MKKILLILTSVLLLFGNSYSQNLFKPGDYRGEELKYCGQYEAKEIFQEKDPELYQEYLQKRAILENETEESNLAQIGDVPKGTVYTIPVVFHVLHYNGQGNISDAQIQDALYILNRDFRKENTDISQVVSQFQGIAGDAEIEFAFATIAPDGTCFEGITRTETNQTNNTAQDGGEAQVNAVVAGNDVYQGIWPHNKYLNIYICRSLISGAAGYTFLPWGGAQATAENMYYNGIFMLHNYTGSIGTSSVTASRALTHEVGHWLNLSHIWGDGQIGTCGDDHVADTPTTTGAQQCNLNQSTCDGTLDNVQNYMDYAYCSKMFTNGQISRMRAAITSSTAGRSNIWQASNLQDVGVTPGGTSLCATIDATNLEFCAGGSTTFSVISEDPILSYSWSFPGGTPSTSTSATPTITYNTVGTYDVSVTITTDEGTSTIEKENMIIISGAGTVVPLPINEGFITSTFPPSGWTIDNGGNQSITWKRNSSQGTAPTAGNSMTIDYFSSNTAGDVDDFISPAFSLEDYMDATLSFDVAYRPYSSNYADQLQILVSAGCGSPYEVVYDKSGSTLQTESPQASAYTNPQVWRNETIDLSSYIGNDELTVVFRGISDWGNHLYIDNINIVGVINNTEPPTPAFNSNTTEVCSGSSVQYTDMSTNAPNSWSWTFPGGSPSTSTQKNPTVVYNTPGTYDVILEVGNINGTQSQTYTNYITVKQSPNVSASVNNSIICYGETVQLTASGADSYSWSHGLGNGASATTSPVSSTSYTVTGTANGCSSTASVSITVLPSPNTPTIVQNGNQLSVNAGSGGSADWYYNGNYIGSGSTIDMVGDGTYEVIVTNASGCTASNLGNFQTSGLLENGLSYDLKLYPNPTSGKVTISSSLIIDEIVILDNIGRVVSVVKTLNDKEVVLDLTHLASGSYHVQTKMGEHIHINKLIVE